MTPGMNVAFPLAIGPGGRAATAPTSRHINDMIEQLIFTNPGERVNRPDFGGGMYQVIFAPNSLELQAAVHLTVLAELQQYLGDLIDIVSLDIEILDETFFLVIAYHIIQTDEHATARFAPFSP
jgi:uncharacterized protein